MVNCLSQQDMRRVSLSSHGVQWDELQLEQVEQGIPIDTSTFPHFQFV